MKQADLKAVINKLKLTDLNSPLTLLSVLADRGSAGLSQTHGVCLKECV